MTATVRDNPTRSRFEITADDTVAGYAEYTLTDQELTLTHTAVDDAFEGRGLAQDLTEAVLAQVRDRGLALLPRCPFTATFISRNPEWLGLVPAARRGEFGLPAS